MTNDIERIKESIDLQMALSELLFKALDMGCWHEEEEIYGSCTCKYCGKSELMLEDTNPSLFTPESFLTVWDAVKDREGFGEFIFDNFACYTSIVDSLQSFIAPPHFQYEVLRWLNPEGLKKIIEEGEGE